MRTIADKKLVDKETSLGETDNLFGKTRKIVIDEDYVGQKIFSRKINNWA